jgi:Tfp pilus assembly protein PilO
MKRSDATVLAIIGIVAVVAAFWFVVLAPKRSHASALETQVNDLQTQLSTQQQTIAAAEQAKSTFASSYHKLVVLGKAVPADSDQASLLVQLNTLADRAGVSFQSLNLNQDTLTAVAPPAPTTSTDTTSTGTTSTSTTSTDTTSTSTDTTSTAATTTPTGTPTASVTGLPTEASAASLPLGAAIGPAGLPVMPYDLTFTGGYFQISKFLHSVDDLVHTPGSHITVSGRLVTLNSFDLAPIVDSTTGAGTMAKTAGLQAALSVTTYVSPADQGLTGGATSTAPAPTTSATAVPTAAPAPAPTTP